MKKLVPDPPVKVASYSFYTINKDMPSPEALLYVIQLLRGIEDTLDEYICGNAGERVSARWSTACTTCRWGGRWLSWY